MGRKMQEGEEAGRLVRAGREEEHMSCEQSVRGACRLADSQSSNSKTSRAVVHSRIEVHLGPVSRVDRVVLVGIEVDLSVSSIPHLSLNQAHPGSKAIL